MTTVSNRTLVRGGAAALAAARLGLGALASARPELVSRPWMGQAGRDSLPVDVLGRAMGGRDAVLGAGALLALVVPGLRAWPWVAAGGVADASDAAATALAWRRLPAGKWIVFAMSTGAVVTSAALCVGLAVTRSR